MKPGARSIRGAMGTYAWVAFAALLLTGLALYYGPSLRAQAAETWLDADAGFLGAVLERDGLAIELAPGERRELPVGRWRLRLFGADGSVEELEVELLAGVSLSLPPTDN